MNAPKRYLTSTCAGFLLALTVSSSAIADDTELLLAGPGPGANNPNIMIIIDTSGSMDSVEQTSAPYDYATSYSGDCDADRVYWTDVDVVPVCDGSNDRYIDKDNFFCQAALDQMQGIGSSAGTMSQYRDGGPNGTTSGAKMWQTIAPGYNSEPVECEGDSGIHGDGRPTYLWARVGANLGDWYTDNPAQEISWDSAPSNLGYTAYDGNYLNWKINPPMVSMQRIDIVKSVLDTLLRTISNVNIGIMRFNLFDGGVVTTAISDLDANRANVLATISGLVLDDDTPLAETMYEAALYWLGLPAYYGEIINEHPTDPAALDSTGPEDYKQPALGACSKNYNVFLTDGSPVSDTDAATLAPTLPGFATVLGRATCDIDNWWEGRCMDDISEYLSKVDLDTTLAGDQFVTTHTIGFKVDLPILKKTAEDSGGTYFLADDVDSLTDVLLEIVETVTERSLSFAAPAVTVNAFNRTQNLNDLYLTTFKPKVNVHWPGNLKKYKLVNRAITDANGVAAVDPATGFFKDTARSFWTVGAADGSDVLLGGAARQLPDPGQRNLYTNNSGSDLTDVNNQITPSSAGSFADADFGLTGAAGEPTLDDIIRWARGEDLLDEDGDPATTVRYAMGDPLHSSPATVAYGSSAANPDVVVFTATNDGYLHAIDGSSGAELWSFVPKELLPRFAKLYFDDVSQYKQYGIDGDVVSVVKDDNKNGIVDGADFVYLIFGLRRGGTSYYALDVTTKNSPKLLWNVSYPEFGQSWSTPVVTRININTPGINADKAVVVLGGGYDAAHDTATYPSAASDAVGAGIHMLDLVSGARLWRVGPDAAAALEGLQMAGMTRSIPSQVRVVDLTGDGFADRMYAADMGGQLLRFDIKNGESPANLVAGGVIAQLGAEALGAPALADTRRFYTTPDVSIFSDRAQNKRFISLSIGSGYRAHPLDNSMADRFFSVRDPDVFNQLTQAQYNNYDVVTDADLVEVSGQVRTVINPADRGWKFTLPANQKVLSDSVTFDGTVTFVGFSPEANSADDCAPSLGRNFLYRVSVENGDPVVNNLDALDPADADDERMEELAQGGIAPSPTILFPSPDDSNCAGTDCAVPPIGCVGAECFDPGFDNNPVRTLWTQDGIE